MRFMSLILFETQYHKDALNFADKTLNQSCTFPGKNKSGNIITLSKKVQLDKQ